MHCLGPPSIDLMRLADFVRQRKTHRCKALYFLPMHFVYFIFKASEKLSWQNPPASQAEEPPTSTLGICHTSLPPFCCFRHSNNNKSTTLGEQTRPNLCQQNKDFQDYSFVLENQMISKQHRRWWEKKLKILWKQTAAATMITRNENTKQTMACVFLKQKAQTANLEMRLHWNKHNRNHINWGKEWKTKKEGRKRNDQNGRDKIEAEPNLSLCWFW